MSTNRNGIGCALHRQRMPVRLHYARRFIGKEVVLMHTRIRRANDLTQYRGTLLDVIVIDGPWQRDVLVLDLGTMHRGFPLAQIRSITEITLPVAEPVVFGPMWEPSAS